MSFAFLATLVLGQWSYAGFIEHPKATVPAPPPKVERRTAECECPPGKCECPDCGCKAPAKPAPPPEAPKPPVAPPVQRWRLADSTGQLWEFHDPEKLKEWVKARNAFPITANPPQLAPPPLFFGGSNCASGQCGR